jgi:alpha-ketoglutarate-dependent 2,4-dichlorophenoxyacetate dioxygenase
MAIALFPFTVDFAAEIGEIDLRHPFSADDLQAVCDALARYAVLIFPAQELTVEQHMAFAAHFGPLERSVELALRPDRPLRVPAEVADIANVDGEGQIWKKDSRMRTFQLMGNRLWHTDSSFKAPSGYVSLLYARSVAPIGGHTQFADLRAAYDALSESMKAKLSGLTGEHSLVYSRARLGFTELTDAERHAFAPVRRPLVRTIPQSGRVSLYIASHIGRIAGLSDEETEALLAELTAHSTQRQFVHTHRWRVGDLVMWDNRCTMHRGTEFDDLRWPRDMQRVTTSDRIDAFGSVEEWTTAPNGHR